ncbi:class I SAM-dependent DNA methyltransferase [Fluviibacter phosphoraccumulans]|uniref:site-specific DNA-methyltransferase (adenine-specific) n=2 Tax=Fluviibacter phosphoraccumulans TaxID=1751046 RepID=A0A679I9A7_9RHOO|nr:DNA methyltransferase [Fluviibacter phosphoraccumulans]BBU68461.1 DNA methyltransferase yeeA [Fluviibacter phosphoraccumulans]BBU72384.1 DNA methyltransferase yeeA [Fluviibacter phosphoraccumulans]BCA66644.1 DNA methyltransferase yeeA [Fluviibacter phosphoraccumulans]
MTPEAFIARWKDNALTERAGAQAHFDDLCDLLGVAKPRDPEHYCFERGAKKSGGGDGWADVWKRGCFGWENKKPGRDLKAALKQLTDYALELENPPLLVVSDRERIEIHTAFTGYPDEPRLIHLADIGQPENLQILRWVFTDPEKLKPTKSLAAITEDAAGKFGSLAEALRERGNPPDQVAHFLTQCLFCMFAEDENLLPRGIFTSLLDKAVDIERATNRIAALFQAMQTGGDYGDAEIRWFNGGLFETVAVPQLMLSDLVTLRAAAHMDWRAIDPSIFGTLFERGLNPKKRSQLGAHYTDPATIMKLVEPVIIRPLMAEWATHRDSIRKLLDKSKKQGDKAYKDANAEFHQFLERLKNYRVLDAACGSGNFLYVALKTLKDIERRVNTEAEQLGLQRQIGIECGPANVLGIELDPYAAELARVTVWIGEIQWMLQNGYPVSDKPILKPLHNIENRDALLNADGTEAQWPKTDAIIGNPPFLGGSKKSGELGKTYFDALNKVYDKDVPGGADLVCYWFDKGRKQILAGDALATGLVSTNSIRGGSNRKVLDAIVSDMVIFDAWADEPWVNDGAAVRVSLVCFGMAGSATRHADVAQTPLRDDSLLPHAGQPISYLDGRSVARINSDLVSTDDVDLTSATRLLENSKTAYLGMKKGGAFDIAKELALAWMTQPNPNGIPNSEVIKPWVNGTDIVKGLQGKWIVDFGNEMPESSASLFEAPFQHVVQHVKPERLLNNREIRRRYWWRFSEPMPAIRSAISDLEHVIVTPRVSKHRIFSWRSSKIIPDDGVGLIARADDTTFGILHSRFHELWSLRMCTWLGVGNDPRYTPTTCFETFPFPAHLTPKDTSGWRGVIPADCLMKAVAEKISAAAEKLNSLREAWLNPPEWVEWVITPEEEKAGFPKRPVAKPGHEADVKKRTLTNLYNARPAWLDMAHKELDAAVAEAYGWMDYTPEMSDEEILRRLLALNLERSAKN